VTPCKRKSTIPTVRKTSGISVLHRKVLKVEGSDFVASAIWEQRPDGWTCIEADPTLAWLKGRSDVGVGWFMQRKGWQYSWHVAESQQITMQR